ALFGKVSVLAEESIAGMNGLGTGIARSFENCSPVEIALGCRWGTEQYREIRLSDVKRMPVRFRIHGHRRNAESAQRANDTACDDASIGDEDLSKHLSRLDSRSTLESELGYMRYRDYSIAGNC